MVNRKVVNRGRYKTPGRFATEVITRDVAPRLQIHYKSSKAKAYLKEGRALRVETMVNNADDFDLHKTLIADNWRALRRFGADTNARFLAAIGEGQGGLPDAATVESVVLPTVHDGQRAPGLCFGDPRTIGPPRLHRHLLPRHQRADQQEPARSDGHSLAAGYTSAQATYVLRPAGSGCSSVTAACVFELAPSQGRDGLSKRTPRPLLS